MSQNRNRIGVLHKRPRRESRYSENSVEKFGSDRESGAITRKETKIPS